MSRWALLCCAPLLFGCANRALVRFDKIARQAAHQDFLGAAAKIKKQRPEFYGGRSELLYHMDLGLLYHYAGLYDSSILFLRRAVAIHDDLYTKSILNEAASLLINDNVRPYRGRPHEIAWIHLFLAFDYLALGQLDDARVEARQGQIFLDEVKRKAGDDASKYRDDGLFRAVSAQIYEALGEKDDAAIALYLAVKAYHDAQQPVPPTLARHAGEALWSSGRFDDVRVLGLDSAAGPLPLPPGPRGGREVGGEGKAGGEIVVVGELGRSPALGENVFWGTWVRDGALIYHYRDAQGRKITEAMASVAVAAPIPPAHQGGQGNRRGADKRRKTRSGTTFHVKWAMPALRETRSDSYVLRAIRDSAAYSGESFADTRDLLMRDLDANRAATLARTAIRVLTRTVAAEEAKSEMNSGNALLNLIFNIGTDALGDQLEQADTRVWFLLPRAIQLIHMPAPPGRHTVALAAETREGRAVLSETREVEVKSGEKTFVFFTSLR